MAPSRLGDIGVQVDVCTTAEVRPSLLQILLHLCRRHTVRIVFHIFVEQASYTMTTALMVEHTVNAIQHQSHVRSIIIHIADASSGIIGIIDDADAQRTVRNQILYFLSVGKGVLV